MFGAMHALTGTEPELLAARPCGSLLPVLKTASALLLPPARLRSSFRARRRIVSPLLGGEGFGIVAGVVMTGVVPVDVAVVVVRVVTVRVGVGDADPGLVKVTVGSVFV